MFRRIENGWRLAKECWRVLQLDRELLLFPLMSLIACALVLASFLVPLWTSGVLQASADNPELMSEPAMLAGYFAFYFIAYFVMIFFNSALVACAVIRFRGGDPTVADGLRAAVRRLPKILAWSAVSAVIGIILKAIEQRSGALGRFIVGLLGAGWAIASYFAIPVLVIENAGPIDALKRSASIIRKTWGEALTAEIGMSLLVFVAALPAVLIFIFGAVTVPTSAVLGGAFIALAVIWVFGVILAAATLDAILKAALYLYASDGKVPHNFDNEIARSAFARK